MENSGLDLAAMDRIDINKESFYRISNSDSLRPFFMSIVSDANHWLFISSNGGLSAGRQNSDFALFPYYTDDKITESADLTGAKSLIRVQDQGQTLLWEPFSNRLQGVYQVSRNLYKNIYGNKIMFEEINHDLNLVYCYQWNTSDRFGFVKKCCLINKSDQIREITLIDGIQNVVPYGVGSDLQNQSSNLVDAYKRNQLDRDSGLGIFALSAIIVDKAEPSEALKANIAWSTGLPNPQYLLSSLQLDAFRKSADLQPEYDVKGEKGAFFTYATLSLEPHAEQDWILVADVNQNHADVIRIADMLINQDNLNEEVLRDVELGTKRLIALNASSDGLQKSGDDLRDTRHFSNTLFNIMRGGVFDNNYLIEKWDFQAYLAHANDQVFAIAGSWLAQLPEVFTVKDLQEVAAGSGNNNFIRLTTEYLPLKFSRRHGDPSRPWNKFSINTRAEDGSKILDYEGNWRDIFQNWEALAYSFPEFLQGMIHKFLNASTFDGYNPYRVTKGGIDWEVIEPDDPWSYIGYWGDHQLIYLLKFLELSEAFQPGKLRSYFDQNLFVYAQVPYRIKTYEEILKDPKDTIEFDQDCHELVEAKRAELGADGALLSLPNGDQVQVNFIEKILATLMAKLSNFIPEAGIWMNTQRPEWNDANNALVGNGVSMVTLYYMRRFVVYLRNLLASTGNQEVLVSDELLRCYHSLQEALLGHKQLLQDKINDTDRKRVMDALGQSASEYRSHIYDHGFSGTKSGLRLDDLNEFLALILEYLEHTIDANCRPDHMYHAYNLITIDSGEASIDHLDEMLEGQVAVLSSFYLSGQQAVKVLDSMRASNLYREDQQSYLLYPNKQLPGFLQKNIIDQAEVKKSKLLAQLIDRGDVTIVEQDFKGQVHFNGNFKNANDLSLALDQLKNSDYAALVKEEGPLLLQIFESVFNHKAFTGRSGTFYGYEGLGSIYWHMVSKLGLAVLECCQKAAATAEPQQVQKALQTHYYQINQGIGVHKSPQVYGAFPTDPYSHTPAGKGAQQPGMTGQVKEDIIARFGELGITVSQGVLAFKPYLLRQEEFLLDPVAFDYIDVDGNSDQILMSEGTLGFTYCQVPIIYQLSEKAQIEVVLRDDSNVVLEGMELTEQLSGEIFSRSGKVTRVNVLLNQTDLI